MAEPTKQRRPQKSFIDKGGYVHEVYSAKALATGVAVPQKFFDGQNEAFDLTYRSGTSPFESGRGALLGLGAAIVLDNGDPFSPSSDVGSYAALTAYAQLYNRLMYDIKRATRTVHRGMLANLLAPPERLLKSLSDGTPPDAYGPVSAVSAYTMPCDINLGVKYSLKFKQPIAWESVNEAFDFDVSKSPNVAAALDTGVLVIYAAFLEFPDARAEKSVN